MNKKIIGGFAWVLLLAALAAVYIGTFEGKSSRYYNFYNADALYIPTVYRDLSSGYPLLGWNPPAVPYFFPDIPVYFLINALVGNFHLAIVLYGVVQFMAIIVGFILISDQIFGRRQSVHFLILIAGIAAALHFATGGFSALIPIFVSAYHFGALLSSIFSVCLILHLLRTGPASLARTAVSYGGLFLVTLLTIAADAIYLVQFLVPALFGFWILFLGSKISLRRLFRFYVVLIPAAPLGYWLNRALLIYRPAHAPQKIELGIIAENFVNAKHGIISAWTQGSWFSKAWMPAFTILWTCFMLLTLVIVYSRLFRGMPRTLEIPPSRNRGLKMVVITTGLLGTVGPILVVRYGWLFWGTFVVTSAFLWGASRKRDEQGSANEGASLYLFSFFLSLVFATVSSALLSGAAESRYLLPALLIPLFFGWPFLLASSKRFMKAWEYPGGQIGVVVVLVVLLMMFGDLSKIAQLSKVVDFYPDHVRSLDGYAEREHVYNGIAQYWLAKPITMLSKKNLLVVQAGPGLAPFHWINNINTYNHRFDFILTESIIRDGLVQDYYGVPANRYPCRDDELKPAVAFDVLVYNRPQDADFQDRYHRLFDLSYDAIRMASETGRVDGSSRIGEASSGDKGLLAKTPPLDLWIGDYQFEIAYFAAHHAGSSVGTWEAVLRTPQNKEIRLENGKIEPNERRVISGVISIRKTGRTEIRTYFLGQGVLRIDSIRLQRIR